MVKTKDFENYKRTGVRGGNANIRALTAERRMIEIAQQTGGAVYSPIDEDEMNEAFKQISAELSQQYILSYYPEAEADKRGEFRSISLTVKGKPNVTIRTRKGYYVPKRMSGNAGTLACQTRKRLGCLICASFTPREATLQARVPAFRPKCSTITSPNSSSTSNTSVT